MRGEHRDRRRSGLTYWGILCIVLGLGGSLIKVRDVSFRAEPPFLILVGFIFFGFLLFSIDLHLQDTLTLPALSMVVVGISVLTGIVWWLNQGTRTAEIVSAAIEATASSSLPADGDTLYGPDQTLDGNDRTAWNDGVDGSGVGETLTYEFDRPYDVSKITLSNGYQKKIEDADLFAQNSRFKDIVITTENGFWDFLLRDDKAPQTIERPFGMTRWVEIKAESVYQGTGGKRDDGSLWEPDLAMSEVSIIHESE